MRALALALGLALAPPGAAQAPAFTTWRLDGATLASQPPSADAPLPVGSLQKPFVARAWARAHPGAEPPRFTCGPLSGCWSRAGHGDLGLRRATSLSCNAYFLALARDTPLPALAAEMAAQGFSPAPRTAEEAVGLEGSLAIRPSALLGAYRRLVQESWPGSEPVRSLLLEGLRDAALQGTAKALDHLGFFAKTGTVPDPGGSPTATVGLALALEEGGWAILGRLEPGTGREAAAALAPVLDRLRPWAQRRRGDPAPAVRAAGLPATVRVRMLGLLGPRSYRVKNLGAEPIPFGRGFLGLGAEAALTPGLQAGPGLLELRAPGVVRRLQGRVSLEPKGLLARVEPRDYVAGVVAAELPPGNRALRIQLGAAVLRFLARGPRHAGADVCDTTHCAWFIGRGPRLDWKDPHRAQEADRDGALDLDDAEWAAIQGEASRPGPDQWTGNCGGMPLAPRAVWGEGSGEATPCPRHRVPCDAWERRWSARDLAKAFGAPVTGLAVAWEDGVWTLRLEQEGRSRSLRYDEAHGLLAAVLGWDALPSPAESVEPDGAGFRVRGHGRGHRVGLCLGP